MVEEGQEFDSWDSLKMAVRAYAVDEGFSFRVIDSNKTCWLLRCEQQDCPFRLRAILSKKDDKLRITQLNSDHSCVGTLAGKCGSHTNHRFLVDLVSVKTHFLHLSTQTDMIAT
jgi:hypothetical protein